LDWGQKVAYFAARGRECPEKVPPRPELPAALLWYWEAFREVGADRSVGMGTGRIPFISIDRYADRYGIADIDAFERFRAIIRAMDTEFLAPRTAAEPGTVSVNDADGVRSLLQRLAKPEES
jgi:hypothetical protein